MIRLRGVFMSKLSKKILILVILIIIIITSLFITYKVSFEPKVKVTSIDSKISVDTKNLIKKFIPNNLDLNLSGIKLESSVSFSEEEVTNLIISFIKSNSINPKELIGLKTIINNDHLLLYINFNYKGIPLQAVSDFTISVKNNDAVLHYNSGKIGFINIPKSYLFDYIENNSIISKDEVNNNIFISLHKDYGISIKEANLDNSKLNLKFQVKLNF